MALIPLTQGLVCVVDEADLALVADYKWFAKGKGDKFYASRSQKVFAGAKCTGRTISMHRVILGLDFGDKRVADHINRDTLDNRRCNLRICTAAENTRNRVYKLSHKTSRFHGVSRTTKDNAWYVSISHHGKVRYVGQFQDEVEAAKAYDVAALAAHGEFAVLNFPPVGHPSSALRVEHHSTTTEFLGAGKSFSDLGKASANGSPR